MTIQCKFDSIRVPIMEGVEMRSMAADEFNPLFWKFRPVVFSNQPSVDVRMLFSDAEKAALDELNSMMGSPLQLNLGIFRGSEFIGWHSGHQKSREDFYMMNTAIFPEFQGMGIYTAMLKIIPEVLTRAGFQVISSKHSATNNRVIVPKLKAGFVISGLEISDRFGTLVRLEYFTNPKRRELMHFRSGQALPDLRLRDLLGL